MTGQPRPRSTCPKGDDCWIGIDLGTSGVRAIAVDAARSVVAEAATGLPEPIGERPGRSEQDPELWWQAVVKVLRYLSDGIRDRNLRGVAVDGTSSTLLLCNPLGQPLTPALMYNDSRSRDALDAIARVAPADSPVHSAGSSLAKLLHLRSGITQTGFLALHQADWILGRLCGRFGISDENNCLKLGYDPLNRCWPDWLADLDLPSGCLPEVHPPGTLVGRLTDQAAALTGLPGCARLLTGTTDSNAATLAAGASRIGDAVTSLGSTLVLKILSDRPVFAPEYGVYSHRLGEHWLVGGASNSGGAACAAYFSREQMTQLTQELVPERPTGLDYYPLLKAGERFPVNDPDFTPRLLPRPQSDREFFQGILEGIAKIEKQGYQLLQQLGAPEPNRVISIGGGAGNEPWRQIRERLLGVKVLRAEQPQAAYGSALLAMTGCLRG